MKPLISYYGGKQRIAARIVKLLPPHTIYAEPFAGGLSVLFAKGFPEVSNYHNYREVINDTNKCLVTLYRMAKLEPTKLHKLIDATLFSRAEYERAVSIYRNPEGNDDLTVAWATYVAAMQSFANKIGHGWQVGFQNRNLNYTFNNAKGRSLDQLKRLEDCHIECDDALKVIQRWDKPQTLFYLDPPYPNTTQGHYSGYTQDDFNALIDILKDCKASFVLSGYLNDVVPKEWYRVDIRARASASNGKHRASHDTDRVECLWVVDRSSSMPPKLAKIATDYRDETSKKVSKPTLFD